ncbi:MAG: hypothetical protein MJ193_04970 [Clostridia bacterium]|nr:hypothetical protein [Clostridia bacterium]
MNSKVASYIGLAQRAGNVVYGEDQICEKLKNVKVILIDNTATDAFKTRIQNKCGQTELFVIDGLKDALHREQVFAIGITNADLAQAITNQLR